ncbi:tetratricopeptide repeat protein [Jannaschia sp. LMIT008]|uniref:tetratricopeptide repeat protein n=1 Tax=Jannaschia maritima TaxID=3032585 RepID=UPI002811CB24|nr:tetratricopeptide repeat protein [Jannaschia sp. LMIT008]
MTRLVRLAILTLAALALQPVATAAAQVVPDPLYAAVLRTPDDPAVNLTYARARLEAGDPQGAVPALERILIAQPGADAVRLLYADTLLRLGDAAGAERELAILRDRGVDIGGRLARARSEADPLRGRMTVFTGLRHDSDPGLGVGDRSSDVTGTLGVQANVQRDLGGTGGGYAFADLLLRGQEPDKEDDLGGIDGALTLGVDLPFGDVSVRPYAFATVQPLSEGGNRDEYGLGLGLRWTYDPRSTVVVTLSTGRTEYDEGAIAGRDGDVHDAAFGWRRTFGPDWSLRAGLGFRAERTSDERLSFDAPRIGLGATYLTGPGRLTADWTFEDREYDGNNIAPTGPDRVERRHDLRLAYTRALPQAGDGAAVQLGLRHVRRASNVARIEGRNTSVEVLFLRGFEFP